MIVSRLPAKLHVKLSAHGDADPQAGQIGLHSGLLVCRNMGAHPCGGTVALVLRRTAAFWVSGSLGWAVPANTSNQMSLCVMMCYSLQFLNETVAAEGKQPGRCVAVGWQRFGDKCPDGIHQDFLSVFVIGLLVSDVTNEPHQPCAAALQNHLGHPDACLG